MCNYLPIGKWVNHVLTEVNWSFDIDITSSKSQPCIFQNIFQESFKNRISFFSLTIKMFSSIFAHCSVLKKKKGICMVLILQSPTGAFSTGKQSWVLPELVTSYPQNASRGYGRARIVTFLCAPVFELWTCILHVFFS